jgi:chromosome segregation ATPase
LELDKSLKYLATKYEVNLEPIPECSDVTQAPSASTHVASALSRIRSDSNLQRRLTDINGTISQFQSLKDDFKSRCDSATELRRERDSWLKENGKPEDVTTRRKQLESDLAGARATLKAASELRQLLVDARQYIEHSPSDNCPVCEQTIESSANLVDELSTRLNSMTSEEFAGLEVRVVEIEGEISSVATALQCIDEIQQSLKSAQETVDQLRGQVVEALGGTGIPESKVIGRLDEAILEARREHEELAQGAKTIEEDLSKIQADDRRIHDGLLPVLRSRLDLAQLEDDWKEAQKSRAADEAAAAKLESIADQFTELREALLEAKNEIATDTLAAASPRAEELYKRLVRHPVFDRMKITTVPKANKIDYSFEVSANGEKSSAREARLVLSDGQVTATAIGLFFALSDADTHNLDLLYVDDPTQNLDLPCKEAMAKVIVEIGKQRQVVVSTQDEDFVSFLEAEGFFDSAVVHHLERWDGNPVVTTRVAQ